ncbi:DMT family transporter [Nostoc sp. CHAB 5715]|uniref:DMT family transporter n=1 Tax=Nostoc sp. CHAB 5715 TaxID=2780400 RepID=UPI001E5DF19A|nr:DMT family transporter [Nostoc sp. CHAB 5715]MCC5620794.1 DMT family transporter [Nostoc sp. CHAB 5715]
MRKIHVDLGPILLTTAMILVGSTVPASRIISTGLPPFLATTARFCIAVPIFIMLLRIRAERIPKMPVRDWMVILLQASAGSVGYTVLLLLGSQYAPAATAGVILGSLPGVMTLLAIAFLGERPSIRSVVAVSLAVGGVIVVMVEGQRHATNMGIAETLIGYGALLGAVSCEATFLLLNRKLKTALSPFMISSLMCVFGLILAVVPAMFELREADLARVPGSAVIGVVYYALVPTIIGFLLWYEGSARTSAFQASVFTSVMPVSAIVLSAVILSEPVTPQQLMGITMVVSATLLGARR